MTPSEFIAKWQTLWSAISQRKIQQVDLKLIFGKEAPEALKLFHMQELGQESGIAVLFDSNIIPFDKEISGYPCQHGKDDRNEYFVAATAPNPYRKRSSERSCSTRTYLESTEVPFVVIPGGMFEQIHVGDLAIAYLRTDKGDRKIFAIVGDIGPPDQFGEASINLLMRARKQTDVPMNGKETNKLDLSIPNNSIKVLSLLLVGRTGEKILNYTPAAITKVGERELAKWSGNIPSFDRLRACAEAAPQNPQEGFEAKN